MYTYSGTWFNEACKVGGLNHYLHSSIDKYLMKIISQYVKIIIANFMIFIPAV